MAGEAEAPWPACCSCWCCSSTVPRCGPPPSPAPQKQQTSVILRCKMCHSTGSNIHAVTCTTEIANLSYSALQNVSRYRLRYSCSYLHHTNSTPQLFCTANCVTLQAQIFMQLPAPHKQHTSVILHCKMCHTTGSDIQAVICNHRNSTPQLFCTVKCVTFKYSYSYLQLGTLCLRCD